MIIKDKDEKITGHWYALDGSPAYTVTAKNGNKRATNLRDARALNLVPSVTTILNLSAKPALNTWLQEQVLLSALTLPKLPEESESEWIARIMTDSKETSRKARDRGTSIHDGIEAFFKGNYHGEYVTHGKSVEKALNEHFGRHKWVSEQSFTHELKFGGKCDLHSSDGIVVDFKTTDKSLDKVGVYDDHLMQLAAYREGLGQPDARCANIFVHIDGSVKLIEHDQEELDRAWQMFLNLLSFWKIKNRF